LFIAHIIAQQMTTRQSDTDKLVVEYLLAKGYSKAAAELIEEQNQRNQLQSEPLNRIIKSGDGITYPMDPTSKDHNMSVGDRINVSNDYQVKSNLFNLGQYNNGINSSTNDSSAHATPISNFTQDLVIFGVGKGNAEIYMKQYQHLRQWAYESIDLVKDELLALCFPIFVHR
jgi:WD40 associated region in TFIID subunit, NTD2 domain